MANNTQAQPIGRETDTRALLILALTIVPTVLSCMSVALRLYAKQKILHGVGLDDYAIVIAQTLAVGVAAVNIVGVKLGGWGHRQAFITPEERRVYSKASRS
ncbi:hypothetical protein GQ44DRAFT_778554 [Phaeosphaeriaceae sp. PMI808]|nr:hypothetical protein GQ44DRAFT_778554 [Phaeosphaeriaceae sp. PMI808]